MAYDRKLSVYHDKRRDGFRAVDALAIARHEIDIWNCPFGAYGDDSYALADGRTVHATVEPDGYCDDWTGDCFGETIEVRGYHGESQWQSTEAVRGSGEVYLPSVGGGDYAARRAYASKRGAARGPAHDAAVQSMRDEFDDFQTYQSGEVYPVSIYIAVHDFDGTEIGRDCIGGVDSESVVSAIIDHAMIENAIADAAAYDADVARELMAAHGACVGANV